MNNYKSLVILDTQNQILEDVENCDLISFRGINLNSKNINKINIDLSNEKFLFNQKKEFLRKKKRIS